MGQQQTCKQGRNVGGGLLTGEFLQAGNQGAQSDIGRAEVYGDGDNVTGQVQGQHIVLLAEGPQEPLGKLFHAAGVTQHHAKDAAENDQQADTRHNAAKAAGQIPQGVRQRDAAEQGHQDGTGKQRHTGADFQLDQCYQQHDHGDDKRDQDIHRITSLFFLCFHFFCQALCRSILPGYLPVNCLSW